MKHSKKLLQDALTKAISIRDSYAPDQKEGNTMNGREQYKLNEELALDYKKGIKALEGNRQSGLF